MRVMGGTETPIGLAILLGALSWLSAQLVASVDDTVQLSYQFRSAGDPRSIIFELDNNSAKRSLLAGKFNLVCPSGSDCLQQLDGGALYADADAGDWQVNSAKHANAGGITVQDVDIPAGGALALQLSLTDPDQRPSFKFVGQTMTETPAPNIVITRQQVWSGWPRHLIGMMFWSWVGVGLSMLVWLFWPAPKVSAGAAKVT